MQVRVFQILHSKILVHTLHVHVPHSQCLSLSCSSVQVTCQSTTACLLCTAAHSLIVSHIARRSSVAVVGKLPLRVFFISPSFSKLFFQFLFLFQPPPSTTITCCSSTVSCVLLPLLTRVIKFHWLREFFSFSLQLTQYFVSVSFIFVILQI